MPKLDIKRIMDLRRNSLDSDGNTLLVFYLSNEIGLSPKVVARMESDEDYNPGVFTLLKLSEYFNVSIDSLIIKD